MTILGKDSDTHVMDTPTIPTCFIAACAVHRVPSVICWRKHLSVHASFSDEKGVKDVQHQSSTAVLACFLESYVLDTTSRFLRLSAPVACIKSATMRLRKRLESLASGLRMRVRPHVDTVRRSHLYWKDPQYHPADATS